jgi:hypothetical protein
MAVTNLAEVRKVDGSVARNPLDILRVKQVQLALWHLFSASNCQDTQPGVPIGYVLMALQLVLFVFINLFIVGYLLSFFSMAIRFTRQNHLLVLTVSIACFAISVVNPSILESKMRQRNKLAHCEAARWLGEHPSFQVGQYPSLYDFPKVLSNVSSEDLLDAFERVWIHHTKEADKPKNADSGALNDEFISWLMLSKAILKNDRARMDYNELVAYYPFMRRLLCGGIKA